MNHNNTLRALLSLLIFIGTIAVNALANILPINNLNTGQVSELYPNLFTPAGLTFSIWSAIYLLLLSFVILAWSRRNDPFIQQLLPWFIVSCFLNITWILLWHYLFIELSVVVMISLLLVLTKIFLLLQSHTMHDLKERIFIELPFTLYFAWICVATIANISALLVSLSWDGEPVAPEIWSLIMMLMATLLAIYITEKYTAPAFALVVMWALFGIYWKWRLSEFTFIINGGVILILILGGVFIHTFSRKRKLLKPV